MQGQDREAGAADRLGQVEILLVAGEAVEQHNRRMRRRATGRVQHRIHRRAVTVDAHIGHAGRMRLVGTRIGDDGTGRLGGARDQGTARQFGGVGAKRGHKQRSGQHGQDSAHGESPSTGAAPYPVGPRGAKSWGRQPEPPLECRAFRWLCQPAR